MQRATHITTGAAISLPVALSVSPLAAAGVIFMGMAGGVLPDYADLHSDFRRVLRHRGFSHSLFFVLLSSGLVYLILDALTLVDDPRVRLHPELLAPLLIAFALGIGSHLILDATTPSGIRPLLPFSEFRLHLLPRGLRIPTGGKRDGLVHLITSLMVTLGLFYLVYEGIR